MSDRALRDELERLQVEVKGLEAELAAEHAPKFFEKREALNAAVKQAKESLLEVERTSSLADTRLAEQERHVETLSTRLRAVEQSQLGAPPFILLGPLVFAGVGVATQSTPFQVVGVVAAGAFGALFGPRLASWVMGRRVEVPAAQQGPRLLQRPAVFSALFAGLVAAVALLGALPLMPLVVHTVGVGDARRFLVDETRFFYSSLVQGAAIVAFLLALRVHRLNGDANSVARRTGVTLASLMLGVLAIIAAPTLVAVPSVIRLWLANDFTSDMAFSVVSAVGPLIPASALLFLAVRPVVPRRWTLPASFGCAAASIALALQVTTEQFQGLTLSTLAAGWTVLTLAPLGAALAQGRRPALWACLSAVGLLALRATGVL